MLPFSQSLPLSPSPFLSLSPISALFSPSLPPHRLLFSHRLPFFPSQSPSLSLFLFSPSCLLSITHCLSVSHLGPFRDCYQVRQAGHSTSGMYLLKAESSDRLIQAWCEQGLDNGGWTVFQRRKDGSVNFFRNWENYKVRI